MKVVVITGGSRGIGAGTALACAARGMGVILTWHRHPDSAAAFAVVRRIRAAGGKAVALPWMAGQLRVSACRGETPL